MAINVALALRRKGARVYLEPAAQVTYLAFAPHVLEDLALLRERWNAAATQALLRERWNAAATQASHRLSDEEL